MRITGEVWIEALAPQVWEVFMDPDTLCSITPGCQMARRVDEQHYEAALIMRAQFLRIPVNVKGELHQAQEPHHLVAGMSGETTVMAGTFHGLLTLDLYDDNNGTAVRYVLEGDLFGRLGNLGEPLIGRTARKIATRFAANVSDLFR